MVSNIKKRDNSKVYSKQEVYLKQIYWKPHKGHKGQPYNGRVWKIFEIFANDFNLRAWEEERERLREGDSKKLTEWERD